MLTAITLSFLAVGIFFGVKSFLKFRKEEHAALEMLGQKVIAEGWKFEKNPLKNVKFRISGSAGGRAWQINQTQSRVNDDIGQDSLEWVAQVSHSVGTVYLMDPQSAKSLNGILGLLTVEMLKKVAHRKGLDVGEFQSFLKDARLSSLRNPALNLRYQILSLDQEKAKLWIDEEAEQELSKWSFVPPSISLTRKELSLTLNLSMSDFKPFKALVVLGLYLSKKAQSIDPVDGSEAKNK